MANEIAFRYPNLSSGVPAAVANPKFAVFAGLQMFNGTAFVAQSDATAWTSECFFALTPISTHGGSFTGDYQANMPGGIDLTQTYTVRMYASSGTPAPGSELPAVQVWQPPANVSNISIETENTVIQS
jgi:hypothetical protein